MKDLAPPTYRSLRQHVRAKVRAAILDGTLPPGGRVIEQDLARRFGISRGPVREALRQLELEGLVRCEPHRGTFVAITSHESHVRELYSLRAVLEGLAARIVATERREGIPVLQQIVERIGDAAGDLDCSRILDHDMELHRKLCEISGHRLLNATYEGIYGQIVGFSETILPSVPDRVPHVARSHQDLVDALKQGDPDVAEQAWRRHVNDSAERLLRILQKEVMESSRQAGPGSRASGSLKRDHSQLTQEEDT